MQTHVQAPAPATTEQARQQQRQPEYETDSAQLLRTPQFEDGRPEVTAQLHQQSLMANSPRTTQLKAMQAMMANSPRVTQLQTTQAMMAASPKVQQLKTTQTFMAAGNLVKQNHQASAAPVTQRMDDEEPLQAMAEEPVQREQAEASATDPTPQDAPPSETPKPNNTGLPDNLKSGIENLSGISMDHVKVHYNSDKPAQLQAHAYAQGSEIHLGAGQEEHLPHEAWHVVQQAQGRVKPTRQMKYIETEPTGLTRATNVSSSNSQFTVNLKVENKNKPEGVSVIQAYGIVNVALDVGEDEQTVYVKNISFHERMPTDADNGKGDHTVAEALITSSLLNVKNCTVNQLLAYLGKLAKANLDGSEVAQHTDRDAEQRYRIDCDTFFSELSQGVTGVYPVAIAGRLGELCTMYWRLLEKRPATAFLRSEGRTTGGSAGIEEAAGMKLLLAIDQRFQSLDTKEWYEIFQQQEAIAKILWENMMDIVVGKFDGEKIYYLCYRAATAVALKMQIENSGWINQVAAYTYKYATGTGIGPHKPARNPFV